MKMSEIAKSLNLESKAESGEDQEVAGGYVSDLLSDVLAHAKAGDIWVTNQRHHNCVAVASLLGLSGLIIAGDVEPDESTIEKAHTEKVGVYATGLSAFEVIGRLYALGVKGSS